MPFRAPHSNKRLLYSRNDLAGPQHSPCGSRSVSACWPRSRIAIR